MEAMKELKGKLIVVTGASSGIGAAIAREAAGRGARVALVARRKEHLARIAERINAKGGVAVGFYADLSVIDAVEAMVSKVEQEMGVPDVLVNNAGAGEWLYLDETSADACRRIVDLPLMAAMQTTRAFLPAMLARGTGRIVNMTSIGAFLAWPGATAYTAARWAMRGFSEALAADLALTNLAVTLAVFAKVDSPYFTNNPGSDERIPKAQGMIRVLTPREAGRTVVDGICKARFFVAAPFMLRLVLFQARWFPGFTRGLMRVTGHRRAALRPAVGTKKGGMHA